MGWDAQVTAHHFDECGVSLGSPYSRRVPNGPEQETGDPQAQSEPKGCGERPVNDGDRPGCSAHQDRLSQSPVHRRDKSCDGLVHHTTTPPPNEKNDKKKLEAANAIESPNTI